jgi:N6-adenosine-specific RNA methylase IME4
LQSEPPVLSFVEETGRQTQTSPRTVAKSAQIGQNICKQAQRLLEGTPVAGRKTDLLRIAQIKDQAEQVAIAKLIHEGKASTFLRAKKLLQVEKIEAEPRPLPNGPFRVIVADPPWHYEKRNEDAGKRENTAYATMDVEDIKALDVGAIAAEDSVLWLWTTNAHLPEAFAVARAWGFSYKTLLTWDKVRVGMGDWLRGQTEHCLLCVRGRPDVVLRGQTTLVRETGKNHSAKPEAFYALVESLCPGAKVELFARKARPQWQVWGLESGE